MCRSIKRLREGDRVVPDREFEEAARQFVRKVTGFSRPSRRHEAAFEAAVADIAASCQALLGAVTAELRAG